MTSTLAKVYEERTDSSRTIDIRLVESPVPSIYEDASFLDSESRSSL